QRREHGAVFAAAKAHQPGALIFEIQRTERILNFLKNGFRHRGKYAAHRGMLQDSNLGCHRKQPERKELASSARCQLLSAGGQKSPTGSLQADSHQLSAIKGARTMPRLLMIA